MPPALSNFLEITSILLMYFMASDYFWNQYNTSGKKIYLYLTGIMQGAMGILLITKKVEWLTYYSMDARAVLLCLTGLVYGTVPAILSASIMTGFTIFYADTTADIMHQASYTIAIAIAAVTIQNRNPKWKQEKYFATIAKTTLISLLIIYASIIMMPWDHKTEIIRESLLPTCILIPLSNILIGKMLYGRVMDTQLKKELELSETKFHKIALCTKDSFWELDTSGIIKYVTGDTMSFIGYSNSELIGIMPLALIDDSESINTLLNFSNAKDDNVFESRIIMRHKRGYKIYCECRGIKTFDSSDRPTGFIGIIHNRTEEHLHDVLRQKNENIMKEQNAEYRTLNDELRTNIKQLRENNRILTETNNKVKEEQASQLAFLSNISHELDAPTSDISKIADAILNGNMPPQHQIKALVQIKEQCAMMRALISDITDANAINKGLIKIKLNIGNIDDLMADIYDYHNNKNLYIYKKPIFLKTTTDLQSTDKVVRTDFTRLRQILSSLINNAYLYTNSGRIDVRCQLTDNNEMLFSVSDTGIGIPENAYNMVFSPYNNGQPSTAKTWKQQNTGLGLSICKSLVEMLGGRIWFESEEGKGTTFYFTIPHIRATDTGISATTSYNWSRHNLLVAGCNRLNNILICNKILNTGARFCNFLLNPESTDKTSLDTSYFSNISLMIVDQRVLSTPGVVGVLSRYPNAPLIITQEKIDLNALSSEIDQKLNAII